MSLLGKKIGVALTGSFCTYSHAFPQIKNIVENGADVQTIFSEASQTTNSRFGKATDFLKKAEEITSHPPILKTEDAEPIGPKSLLDILIILPCTGNTLAKLANGITDTPVLMAAKAHLRNNKPLLLSVATNDGLGMNMKNIGLLLNAKNIYFVPFGQDNPEKKPNSLVADTSQILSAIEAALQKQQLQPVIKCYQ